jgi:ribosomal protein S18 acetylase RimI-like enzyme
MWIERVVEAAAVTAGADLFDTPPQDAPTAHFLASPGHHLLFAYDNAPSGEGAEVIGMVSGVETTHPDKGTEMFLYELGVAPAAQRNGVGTALVQALAALAEERGCYGMWVAIDPDNVAARQTYRRAGAQEETPCLMLSWELST